MKKELSVREKALQFARNNVPKPKQQKPGENNTTLKKTINDNGDIENILKHSPQKKEYDKLEMAHAMYHEEVQQLKRQFKFD